VFGGIMIIKSLLFLFYHATQKKTLNKTIPFLFFLTLCHPLDETRPEARGFRPCFLVKVENILFVFSSLPAYKILSFNRR